MKLAEINQLTKNAYENLAAKYHNSFKGEMNEKAYDRKILDKFSNSIQQNGLICDAGCGPSGHIGKYLQLKGHKIIGIDLSPKCINIATAYEREIQFIEMDMMNTSFEPKKFDGIISFYSIIHTPKKEVSKIVAEFNRILKTNGKVLLVTKKGSNEGIVTGDWYEGHKIYCSNFLESELLGYLKDHQFEIEFIETRVPYNSEIDVERIYIIAKKLNN